MQKELEIKEVGLEELLKIDIEDFKKEINKMNVGTLRGLDSLFKESYFELASKKDALISQDIANIQEEKQTDSEVLKEIYRHLLNIENRTLIINERLKELQIK